MVAPLSPTTVTEDKSSHGTDDTYTTGPGIRKDSIVSIERRTDLTSDPEEYGPTTLLFLESPNRIPLACDEAMMSQTNLHVLPPSNPSYQMAYFLQTTGPKTSRPNATTKGKRAASIPKAFRFFAPGHRRPSNGGMAHDPRNVELFPSDHNLVEEVHEPDNDLPENVVQKISKDGKKYLQIAPIEELHDDLDGPNHIPSLALAPDILESQVSVTIAGAHGTDSLDDWVQTLTDQQEHDRVKNSRNASNSSVRILARHNKAPEREHESGPSTPAPDSGVELSNHEDHKPTVRFAKVDPDVGPLTSNPRTLNISSEEEFTALPQKDYWASLPPVAENVKIIHPSPRRFCSHPVLLQRASSEVSNLRWSRGPAPDHVRPRSGSPGPPPPRSPLRLRGYPQSIESLLNQSVEALTCPRPQAKVTSPKHTANTSIVRAIGYHEVARPISFTSEEGAAASALKGDIFSPALGRRWGSKARSQQKPITIAFADSDAKPPSLNPNRQRRRLRRARPSDPKPVTDLSKIHVQTTITQEKNLTRPDNTRQGSYHVPVMPQMSHGLALPIERVPLPPAPTYARSKPITIPTKGRKSPSPRPRSARMPPRGMRSLHMPPLSRPRSPLRQVAELDSPALPSSPPPNRELPPTPKGPGQAQTQFQSHGHRVAHSICSTAASINTASINTASLQASAIKALPAIPYSPHAHSHVAFPSPPSSVERGSAASPIAATFAKTEASRRLTGASHSSDEERKASHLKARLEAVERHNRLLEAALMAMLKTNGTLNGCPYHGQDSPTGPPGHPAFGGGGVDTGMVERRSVVSRISSTASSGQSALDMYLSTRGKRGS